MTQDLTPLRAAGHVFTSYVKGLSGEGPDCDGGGPPADPPPLANGLPPAEGWFVDLPEPGWIFREFCGRRTAPPSTRLRVRILYWLNAIIDEIPLIPKHGKNPVTRIALRALIAFASMPGRSGARL